MMCIHIYIYIYVYVCIHIYIYIYTHVYDITYDDTYVDNNLLAVCVCRMLIGCMITAVFGVCPVGTPAVLQYNIHTTYDIT